MVDSGTSTVVDDWVGRTLAGRYHVRHRIGEGGIGAVYVAEDARLARNVAVKVLHPQFATTDVLRVRFEREARALSMLAHPNIVTVLDFGRHEDALFLVMELVEGESLADRLRRAPIAPRRALEIMRDVLRALSFAHSRGVVHRDLKPGNILVRALPDGSEHAVVLDFGLAKFEDDAQSSVLTRHGALLGTPAYMAPEQVTGGVATAASDVYASTLILFEMLTGQRVFTSRDSSELLRAHLMTPPPRLVDSRPNLGASPTLEAFVARGLAKASEARFPDARVMLEEFDTLPEWQGSRVSAPSRDVPTQAVSRHEKGKGAAPLVLAMAPIAPPDDVPPSVSGVSTTEGATASVSTGATATATARTPKLVWIFLGLLVVGAIGVVGLGVLVFSERSGTPTSEATPPPKPAPSTSNALAGAETADSDSDDDVAVPSSRVPSRNPWSEPPPAELANIAARIANGPQPSRYALQTLYHYAASHDQDPRAPLLLGRTYTERSWFDDALESYKDAYSRDQSARGDPHMLSDLLQIAQSDRSSRRASSYVVAWYGREALPLVQAELTVVTDPDAHARLAHIRERLNALP